ncbi:HAD family hydrolase [Streptomyces sp. SPB162]|uniref:HAD family hydrolase n=1 Tax=Streptomyces sp. SPB162 TaxID=2940560 RepID=UPI002404FE81|nr:HAD family hydrolase [Streptomyces sp. SPB162]MDF9814740.1 phosphoglycolate phosphatase [Streptomyces sp. SPB162]
MTSPPPSATCRRTRRELVAAAECVLFDFDGPLAGLFGHYRAHEVARVLRRRLDEWGLTPALKDPDNPLQVLRDTSKAYRGTVWSHQVAELQRLLTAEEVRAADSAVPTEHASELVFWLVARGSKVAVTTNNSVEAANVYLARMGLSPFFGAHVHGRPADPELLKPDPFCLREALRTTGARAENCLMIGDSGDDCTAARAAGVTFLGYARNEAKRLELEIAGAEHITDALVHLFEEDQQM